MGLPIYVHAKVCVIDDVWAAVGSANLNRRSWTHDSELTVAVLDHTLDERSTVSPGANPARRFARDLRLQLWREHLDRAHSDDGVVEQPLEQPGVGEQGQGGAAQESLQGRVGQQVQLIVEVATIIALHALTLGGDEIGENPILVVGADIPPDVTQGDQLRVSGIVKVFQVPGYEEDLDLDLVDQEFEDFDGDPAIQAKSVTKA